MSGISTTVRSLVAVPRSPLFEWFIPLQLPDILLGYGPLPAVVGTSGQSGPWDRPGSGRTVHLADGSTAFEEVTVCQRPSYFAYRVSKPTNILRLLVREAVGQWWFEEQADQTSITWTYTFHPHNFLTALLLFPVVRLFWNGYMRVGLTATRQLAEQQAGQGQRDQA